MKYTLDKIEFCKFVGGMPFLGNADGTIGVEGGVLRGWTLYAPGHDPKGWLCESEQEKQLRHVIKLTQQDIEHKQRMIDTYEAQRKELERKRLGNA